MTNRENTAYNELERCGGVMRRHSDIRSESINVRLQAMRHLEIAYTSVHVSTAVTVSACCLRAEGCCMVTAERNNRRVARYPRLTRAGLSRTDLYVRPSDTSRLDTAVEYLSVYDYDRERDDVLVSPGLFLHGGDTYFDNATEPEDLIHSKMSSEDISGVIQIHIASRRTVRREVSLTADFGASAGGSVGD